MSLFFLFLSDCRELILKSYSTVPSTECRDNSAPGGDSNNQQPVGPFPSRDSGYVSTPHMSLPVPSHSVAMTQASLPSGHPLHRGLGWISIDAVLGRTAGLMNGARLTAPIENRVNGKPAFVVYPDKRIAMNDVSAHAKFAQHRQKTRKCVFTAEKRNLNITDVHAISASRRLVYKKPGPSLVDGYIGFYHRFTALANIAHVYDETKAQLVESSMKPKRSIPFKTPYYPY